MAYLIQRIKEELDKSGYEPRTSEARDWLKAKVASLSPNRTALMKDRDNLKDKSMLGRMYFYFYDPKTKDMLPYYDRFPLVFPFKKVKGGFYGLNLHYLPLQFRAKLMDALYGYANNTRYDESTKIKMNYELLAKTAKLRYFAPCVKHYLTNHMRSKFMYIYPSEWDIALFMPVEHFSKVSRTAIWKESLLDIYSVAGSKGEGEGEEEAVE